MNKTGKLLCCSSTGRLSILDRELFDEISGDFERRLRRMEADFNCYDDDALIRHADAAEQYADFLLSQGMKEEALERIEDAMRILKCTENVYCLDEDLPSSTMTIFGNAPSFRTTISYSKRIRERLEQLKSRRAALLKRH